MPVSSRVALLLIDVQQGVDDPRWGIRNNPNAELRIADLLAAWRGAHRPIIHIQHLSLDAHSPLREDLPGHAFKPVAQPLDDEPVFRKHVDSPFVGTELEAHLRANHIESLIVVGIPTDHGVSSTARTAANLGFDVTVVADATATFERRGHDGIRYTADLMHRAALASLHGEFATIRNARDVLADADA